MNGLRHLDDRLLLAANQLARATAPLHPLVVGFAKYGVALFALLLLLALASVRRSPDRRLAAAAWAGAATVLAVAVNQPIGHLFQERRPYAVHPHLLVLATRTSDFSFPSDHAVMAGAAAAGLLLVSRRLGLVAVAAALLMAFSRVYIAAHYPWDVVAGLALGTAVSLLGWLLLRRPLTAAAGWLRRQVAIRELFGESPVATGTTPA